MTDAPALTLEEGIASLAAIVGPAHIRLHGDIVVVAPDNVQQISEILRLAHANGLSVMPTGKGTKLRWGAPLVPDILLSMERMNTLREHSWHDLICTVQAGCPWAAMQELLAHHGQMVALDPLWPEHASVGGIVAVNDSGALRLKYGGLRDLIIGMTIVLADGAIAKTGGKVVKNVAGYDLHKLMTGSYGTLSVIAEVNFRLHPLEEHARTFTTAASDAAQLAAPLHALLDSQLVPASVQLRVRNQDCAADIRIASRLECLDEHAARLREIFAPLAVVEADQAVWQERQKLFGSDSALVLKISLLPGEICSLCSELRQWAVEQRVELSAVAQATGLVTVQLRATPFASLLVADRLRARLRGSQGSVAALEIPELLRGHIDVWDSNVNALPLMREIKRRFDPNRTLNPGRFVGNI